jgi:hypothetical protein
MDPLTARLLLRICARTNTSLSADEAQQLTDRMRPEPHERATYHADDLSDLSDKEYWAEQRKSMRAEQRKRIRGEA